MKIQQKLFLVIAAITIIPLIIFGSLSYNQSSKIIKTRVLVQLQKLGVEQSGRIKNYLVTLDHALDKFVQDVNFQLYARYYNSGKDIGFLIHLMESSFTYQMKNTGELRAVRFYPPPAADSAPLAAYELGRDDADIANYFPETINEYLGRGNSLSLFRGAGGNPGMIIVKPILLETDTRISGYLVFGFDALPFLNIFDGWTLGENEEAIGFILDAGDRFVTHTRDKKVLTSAGSVDFGASRYTDREEQDNFIYLKSPLADIPFIDRDYHLYAAVSETKFMTPVYRLIKMMMLVGIISLGIAFLLSYLTAKTIIHPVESLVDGARLVAAGNLNHQIPLHRTDELGELTDTFNEMIRNLKEAYRKLENQIELVNADLARTNVELKKTNDELQQKQKQLDEELDFARQVQEGLLPDVPDKLTNIDLAARMLPAKAVGGDFFAYDFDPDLPERISIGIGDVSGKGVPAALLMVAARDQFQSITKFEKAPGKVLQALNRSIHHDIGAELFVTFLNAEIDVKNRVLNVASGGHHPALIYRRATGQVEEITSGGIILGMFADMKYQEKVVELNPDDVILLYTDGVIEATAADKDMFGMDRLKALFGKHARETAGTNCLRLFDELSAFIGSEPQYDDITIIVAKIGGKLS